jgi:hypothetical protein
MIIDDFPDIRRRMLGDLKAKPEPVEKPKDRCSFCLDTGWHFDATGMYMLCLNCGNPKGLPKP